MLLTSEDPCFSVTKSIPSESRKTVAVSSKDILCLFLFAEALELSHENIIYVYTNIIADLGFKNQ